MMRSELVCKYHKVRNISVGVFRKRQKLMSAHSKNFAATNARVSTQGMSVIVSKYSPGSPSSKFDRRVVLA